MSYFKEKYNEEFCMAKEFQTIHVRYQVFVQSIEEYPIDAQSISFIKQFALSFIPNPDIKSMGFFKTPLSNPNDVEAIRHFVTRVLQNPHLMEWHAKFINDAFKSLNIINNDIEEKILLTMKQTNLWINTKGRHAGDAFIFNNFVIPEVIIYILGMQDQQTTQSKIERFLKETAKWPEARSIAEEYLGFIVDQLKISQAKPVV